MDQVIAVAKVLEDGHEVDDKLIVEAIVTLMGELSEKGKAALVKKLPVLIRQAK